MILDGWLTTLLPEAVSILDLAIVKRNLLESHSQTLLSTRNFLLIVGGSLKV